MVSVVWAAMLRGEDHSAAERQKNVKECGPGRQPGDVVYRVPSPEGAADFEIFRPSGARSRDAVFPGLTPGATFFNILLPRRG